MLFSLGVGISTISYATGIKQDTLARWMKEVSKYCKNVHDTYIRKVNCKFIQFDELWAFVGSKLNQQWIWSAVDAPTKLLIGFVVAPRKSEYARVIVSEVASRVINKTLIITTDGYASYIKPILDLFPKAMYAQVVKKRKEGRIVKVTKKAITDHTIKLIEYNLRALGLAWNVNTAIIERLNLTKRMLMSRLSRKTNEFSKDKTALKNNVYQFAVFYNFIRPHMSLRVKRGDKTSKRTPAMAANITDKILTWHDVLRDRPMIPIKAM